MKVVTRRQAKAAGLTKYFTGVPCAKAGHASERYTGSGSCVECKRESQAAIKSEKAEYDKSRYRKNRNQVRANRKANYYRNREASIKYSVNWNAENKERRRYISANYKHRRRAIERKGMTYKELMAWVGRQPKICHWCGSECSDDFHTDHYVPLSKGGQHAESNLVIACAGCNLSKSDKAPEEFALSVGRLL